MIIISIDKIIEYGTLIVAILSWFSPMWQTFHANKETKRNDKNNQKDFDVEQEINFYKAKFDDLSDKYKSCKTKLNYLDNKYNTAIEKARQADLLINKIQRKLTFKNKQLSSYQKKFKKFRQVLFYLETKFTDKDRKMLNEKLKEFDDDEF